MNWDAVSAVAEVVGAIGLIISIGYLGLQVRQGNQVAQDAAFQGVFTIALDHTRGMFDGDNRVVVIKGLGDYAGLTATEKIAFDSLMLGLMTVFEAALTSSDVGLLGDEQPDGFGYYFRTRFLPYPGTRDWWNEARNIFSPIVQEWVEAQIASTDMTSDFFGIKQAG